MNEKEMQAIEQAISKLDAISSDLQEIKTKIDFHIEDVENIKSSLVRLLPHDKRIERLFQ